MKLIINQLANILSKYRSAHIKSEIDVIEFRIFSMLGSDIDTQLYNVYMMFSNIKGGKIISKKMKNKTKKRRKLNK